MNRKTSQFTEVLATDSTTFIPLIQGNPLGNRVIKYDNFVDELQEDIEANLNPNIVIDANYVHTDNNLTDELVSSINSAIKEEIDPIYALDKDRLSNTSGTNTGDQDLDGLVEKIANHSLVSDTEINKLTEYPEFEDLEFSHEKLTDKNSEAAVQHVDTTTIKSTLAVADKVALYDSVTGKVVLTPKSNLIDESFKKLAVRRGAVFNELTGFYELNGLTDITEAQMMDIYTYTSSAINAYSLDEAFKELPIRTNYMTSNRGNLGVSARYAFVSSKIEIFKQNNLITTNCAAMFGICVYLKIVDYISLGNTNASLYAGMFQDCTALETCFLRNIKANLSFQWSPLLSLASLKYIIQYRGNGTTPITITVHPTVFAKLTDNVNYPTWYAVAQDALTKFITFATV